MIPLNINGSAKRIISLKGTEQRYEKECRDEQKWNFSKISSIKVEAKLFLDTIIEASKPSKKLLLIQWWKWILSQNFLLWKAQD